jgi:hypothetical protein
MVTLRDKKSIAVNVRNQQSRQMPLEVSFQGEMMQCIRKSNDFMRVVLHFLVLVFRFKAPFGHFWSGFLDFPAGLVHQEVLNLPGVIGFGDLEVQVNHLPC